MPCRRCVCRTDRLVPGEGLPRVCNTRTEARSCPRWHAVTFPAACPAGPSVLGTETLPGTASQRRPLQHRCHFRSHFVTVRDRPRRARREDFDSAVRETTKLNAPTPTPSCGCGPALRGPEGGGAERAAQPERGGHAGTLSRQPAPQPPGSECGRTDGPPGPHAAAARRRTPPHCHFPSLFSCLLSRLHLGFDLHRRDGPLCPRPLLLLPPPWVPGPPAPARCPGRTESHRGFRSPSPCSTAAPRTPSQLPSLQPTHRIIRALDGPTSPRRIVTGSCPHLQPAPHAGASITTTMPPVTPWL